jgi:hypothetical protein
LSALLPAAPAVPAAASQAAGPASWRAVHASLAGLAVEATQAPDFANLAVYHYCVAQAGLASPGHASRAAGQWGQLVEQLEWQLGLAAWPLAQLDQACGAAWLGSRLAAEARHAGGATLPRLDEALLAEALRLHQQPDGAGRAGFFRVLRYFGLRLPAPGARQGLHTLLALPLPAPAPGPVPLGLADGQAAELLLLLKLHQAAIRPDLVLAHLRAGITRLLELRRPVDFLEARYSVFPYEAPVAPGEAAFSAELSWQRGDLGPALLLHEAYEHLLDDELLKMAQLLGLNTLLRTTARTTELATSQLGRGSAGVAHLYARLHLAGGHAAYRAGHAFWLGRTCDFLRHELATGFYQQQPGSLTEGLVGVGLVLLTSLTDTELGWDTLVL